MRRSASLGHGKHDGAADGRAAGTGSSPASPTRPGGPVIRNCPPAVSVWWCRARIPAAERPWLVTHDQRAATGDPVSCASGSSAASHRPWPGRCTRPSVSRSQAPGSRTRAGAHRPRVSADGGPPTHSVRGRVAHQHWFAPAEASHPPASSGIGRLAIQPTPAGERHAVGSRMACIATNRPPGHRRQPQVLARQAGG
jgi:hypothetical protein